MDREGPAHLDERVQAGRQVEELIAAHVDDLAAAGVCWPVLDDVPGVSRKAAREAHVRRHARGEQQRAAALP